MRGVNVPKYAHVSVLVKELGGVVQRMCEGERVCLSSVFTFFYNKYNNKNNRFKSKINKQVSAVFYPRMSVLCQQCLALEVTVKCVRHISCILFTASVYALLR